MARFFLIDQSLVDRGGHHYDYTTCIVAAANQLGFDTLIAANRKVATGLTVGGAPAIPAFTETVYQKDSSLAGLRQLKRVPLHPANGDAVTGWRRSKSVLTMRRFHQRRARLVSKFATEFQSFFDQYPVAEDDQVFLTTVSELELMGLAKYLRANPTSVLATWHLQFHFNIFEGRTPEYESQKTTENLVRSSFRDSLAKITCHHLFFYTTSQPLADQYNRLDVGEFSPLPYPVAPEFSLRSGDSRLDDLDDLDQRYDGKPRPLQFACPGQIRREKGCSDYLQPLVDKLWDSHLANGKVKIAIQRPRKKFLRKEKIELQAPHNAGSNDDGNNGLGKISSASPFKYYAHPLSRPDYIEFLRNADCGLLMYDSRAYYSRRAGVLGEMLSCGKPLIVPAGSWLASQIAGPVFKHADLIEAASSKYSRRLGIDELEWNLDNAPSTGGAISFDGQKHPFSFSLNRQSTERMLKIDFQWKWPTVAGTYCRISVTQKDGAGDLIGNSVQVVGHRDAAGSPNALFRMESMTQTVHVTLSNAFGDSTAMIRKLSASMLVPGGNVLTDTQGIDNAEATPINDDRGNGNNISSTVWQSAPTTATASSKQTDLASAHEIAIGSVGIIVADQSQLEAAVHEMVRHFDHYRSSAEAFADQWFAMHHPKRTVAHLLRASDRGRNSSNST